MAEPAQFGGNLDSAKDGGPDAQCSEPAAEMTGRALAAIYCAVVVTPLALAYLGMRDPRSIADEVATAAGLLAYSIMLVEFVLSGRFRSVSDGIGIDVTMRFHQLMARTALLLVVLHPFLYNAPFAPARPWDTTRQLTLSSDVSSLMSGMVAWALLPAFVLLSIGRDTLSYKYETWRLMHGLGAALIAALVLHHTLTAGRYSQDPALAWMWIALFAGAMWSLIYVYVLKPAWQSETPWRVSSVRPICPKTWEVSISPSHENTFSFKAGQFVWLNIGSSPYALHENPFSLSSAPARQPDLQFVIKELGDFTSHIGDVQPGTLAYVDGPHGDLVVDGRQEPGIALIAGGVGVAPMLSILRQLALEGDRRPLVLIYANRTEEQIAYRDELDKLAQDPQKRVIYVVSEPAVGWTGEVGFVAGDLLEHVFSLPQLQEWLFLLCGPNPMMDSVEEDLLRLGTPAQHILSERFAYD